jgi:protein SCO1/2
MNRIGYTLILAFVAVGASPITGCARRDQESGGASQPPGQHGKGAGAGLAAPARVVVDYPLKGVVKRVEKELERLTIDHEAIPGFMDAMKMSFPCSDQALLENLKPGDSVTATLQVAKENEVVIEYHLRDVAVTKPGLSDTGANGPLADSSQGPGQVRRLETGDHLPDFSMTDQDGKTVKLADLRGNVVVLTFIYTRCPLPDFCPLMDRKFAELAQHLSNSPGRARYVRLISLSFDPDHDTADVLRKHAQVRGATPPLWTFAVASHDELAKIAGPLGLFYGPGKDDIAHNLCTAIIDQEGKLARLEVGTTRNKWETISFIKSIYSLISTSRS